MGGCVPHRTLVNDDSTWFMQCEELMIGIVGGVIAGRDCQNKERVGIYMHYSHFASIAEVEVVAIEAFVTNTDDRSLVATIAGDVVMDNWAWLARSTVVIERIHRDDGAPRGDGPGDKFKRVIESSTVNCVCGMISRALATLKSRIDAGMSAIYTVRPRRLLTRS